MRLGLLAYAHSRYLVLSDYRRPIVAIDRWEEGSKIELKVIYY